MLVVPALSCWCTHPNLIRRLIVIGELPDRSPFEPGCELLDPDRPIRKTPGIARIGQAVAEYDNVIDWRRVLRRRAHHACRYRPDQDD
jgi:hypothetical protein